MKLETEFTLLNEKDSWNVLFMHLRAVSSGYEHSIEEALKLENQKLNRYADVSPFDHSRIVLQNGPVNYINANIVKVEKAQRSYILTQGPLPDTASHFWLMVWEQGSSAIIMLNKVIETNMYFPLDEHAAEMHFDNVRLTVSCLEVIDEGFYKIRKLRLRKMDTKESTTVLHFHYLAWPDFGVPQSPGAFLKFLQAVRLRDVLENANSPAVIHCSAGIGRSGTFCLVDSALLIMEKEQEDEVNLLDLLLDMRHYRMGLIQTAEQLKFSYQAILAGRKQIKTLEHWRDIRENEEESPPIPPLRSQSLSPLKSDSTFPDSSKDCVMSPQNSDSLNSIPNKPLPSEPVQKEEHAEVRKRRRQKEQEELATKVEQMKKKQRAQEHQQQRKRWLWHRGVQVVLLTSVVGCAILLFRFFLTV